MDYSHYTAATATSGAKERLPERHVLWRGSLRIPRRRHPGNSHATVSSSCAVDLLCAIQWFLDPTEAILIQDQSTERCPRPPTLLPAFSRLDSVDLASQGGRATDLVQLLGATHTMSEGPLVALLA